MRFLPMFPLQIVVFPKESLNLHIFEPRYKQLVRECHDQHQTFGIPAFFNGQIMDIGTEVLVKRIEKVYQDGKMDIRTLAKGLFRIHEYHKTVKGKLFGGADVEDIPLSLEGDIEKNIEIIALLRKFYKTLKLRKRLPDKTSKGLSFKLGHLIGLHPEQEYELLEIPSESERQDYIIEHLKALLPVIRETEELRKKAQMNGHFRVILPPEI